MTDKITLTPTCGARQEQYDASAGGEQVGHLLLRRGKFTVECPDVGGEVVLSAEPNGDGSFDDDERDAHLAKAIEAIRIKSRHCGGEIANG